MVGYFHMKNIFLKKGTTLFLKVSVVAIGLIVLALCIFALPHMWRGGSEEFPMAGHAVFLIMIGLYVTTVPFFIALWQALLLLGHIEKNSAFSDTSVRALKNIKYCAIAISVLYVGGVPLLYPIADAEDAPGLILFGTIIACIPIVVAVFAAVLQRLFQNGIDIKSENELTV